MSGDFRNTSRIPVRASGPHQPERHRIWSSPGRALLGVAAALALGLASGAAADPTPTQRPQSRPDAAAEPPVAMPPDGRTAASAAVGSGPAAEPAPGSPPLTRAAERRRIESMTPSTWLAGFGPISVQHSE